MADIFSFDKIYTATVDTAGLCSLGNTLTLILPGDSFQYDVAATAVKCLY